MQRFSDFAKEQILTGDKIKIDEVVDKEIAVLAYRLGKSKFKDNAKEYLQLQIEIDGTKRIIFTGSNVLVRQIAEYKEYIPFITTITKVDKYYTFS